MRGLCHADLAKDADISEATVSYSLSDHISEDSAKRLAAALGMALEEAFKVEEPLCLSSSTVRMYHKIISAVLAQAVREGLIPVNPASRAISPKDAQKEAEHLEPEQLERPYSQKISILGD